MAIKRDASAWVIRAEYNKKMPTSNSNYWGTAPEPPRAKPTAQNQIRYFFREPTARKAESLF
jgi:hypothetical protein